MSKVFIEESTLTAIGEAIREKTGKFEKTVVEKAVFNLTKTQNTTKNPGDYLGTTTTIFQFSVPDAAYVQISNFSITTNQPEATINFRVSDYNVGSYEGMTSTIYTYGGADTPETFEPNSTFYIGVKSSVSNTDITVSFTATGFDHNGDVLVQEKVVPALISPKNMPTEIASITTGGGGGGELEPVVLKEDCKYICSGPLASIGINTLGNLISTENIYSAMSMFSFSTVEEIPFEINMRANFNASCERMFEGAKNLKVAPKINNCKPSDISYLFYGCASLEELPDDYFDDWNFTGFSSMTSAYSGNASSMFNACLRIRKFPVGFGKYVNPYATSSYTYYKQLAYNCYCLRELSDLPVPYTKTAYTSNILYGLVYDCHTLKKLTFETPNGQPVVVQWAYQNIALDESAIGYCSGYPDQLDTAKRVADAASYEALKNDPDWWGGSIEYSCYGHNAAVETINSLPDASAYLASSGGSNTIAFRGAAGSATDGGAINTLTEEEIAVAAAKGWTVSFT